jgi:uncharacterized membrane protein required for colicin V production
MPIFDAVILIILGGFVLFGLWFGFIHAFGALVGTIAGAFLASRMYEPVAQWLHGAAGGSLNLWRVLVFLFLFVIINRLVGLLFWVIEKAFRFLTIIPFLRTIDRLLGAVLGFIEGVLVLGLTLYFASRFPFAGVADYVTGSAVARWLIGAAGLLVPLIPEAIRAVRGAISR